MINIRTLKKITNNGGLTLKNGKPITYKSGWQVATEGKETTETLVKLYYAKKATGRLPQTGEEIAKAVLFTVAII